MNSRTLSPSLLGLILVGALVLLVFALAAVAPNAQAVDRKDCSDFDNQRQAQRWFHRHHPHRDPSGLDADHDGIACESLPCPCSSRHWKHEKITLTLAPRPLISAIR